MNAQTRKFILGLIMLSIGWYGSSQQSDIIKEGSATWFNYMAIIVDLIIIILGIQRAESTIKSNRQ